MFFCFVLLEIACTIMPVTPIIITVVNIHTTNNCHHVDFIIPIDAIRPTPAGMKKKAKWSNKKFVTLEMLSTLTVLVHNKINNITIPKILPGIGN